MIIEFSVKNFRSIRDLQTLSFKATGLKSPSEFQQLDIDNIISNRDESTLKTIGIYGANASGKSNIVFAFQHFIEVIRNEPSQIPNLSGVCDPFLYQEDAEVSESFFQVVMYINNKKFRYGFTVNKDKSLITPENPNGETITSEWLYGTKHHNMTEYFLRKGGEIRKTKNIDFEKIPEIPYSHTLFLTHAAAFDNAGVCASIRHFFKARAISNLNDEWETFRWNSVIALEIENRKQELLDFLSHFNLKYSDVEILREGNNREPSVPPYEKITFTKDYWINHKKKSLKLNLKNNESSGTQKLFDLAGLILRAFTFGYNGLIIIDEIDSNFHPSLLIKIINLFNSKEHNKSDVQLLFTSHDTNLMSPSIMRRDQFYFTEKGEDESTRLYSLADLKGIRNDADFARQYLAGFYGALPVLDEISNESFK